MKDYEAGRKYLHSGSLQLFLDLTRPLRAKVDMVVDPDREAHALQMFCEGMGVFGVLMAVTDKDVTHSDGLGTRTLLEVSADALTRKPSSQPTIPASKIKPIHKCGDQITVRVRKIVRK